MLVDEARLAIHSRYVKERRAAREVLVRESPPRHREGETFHDWLLGDVEVLAVWPVDGSGSEYAVRRLEDPEAPYSRIYLSGDSMEEMEARQVVAMGTRKVHRQSCRHVTSAGSMDFPYADAKAIELLPHCKVCAG